MNDNALVAIIAAVCISSCTACSVTDKILDSNKTPLQKRQEACVRSAWGTDAQIKCMQAKP